MVALFFVALDDRVTPPVPGIPRVQTPEVGLLVFERRPGRFRAARLVDVDVVAVDAGPQQGVI